MHRAGCFSSQFTSEEKRKKENSKKSEKKLKYFLIFQVYPDKDINNIVESNHYTKISGWCKLGRTKCKGPARWVKPYRCLGMLLHIYSGSRVAMATPLFQKLKAQKTVKRKKTKSTNADKSKNPKAQ